jgi:hypothetical protein
LTPVRKQHAKCAGPFRLASSVAIAAHDLAFLYLLEDALPVSVRQSTADIEFLIGQVVELEDDWVGFAAVDARMAGEELDQVLGALDV